MRVELGRREQTKEMSPAGWPGPNFCGLNVALNRFLKEHLPEQLLVHLFPHRLHRDVFFHGYDDEGGHGEVGFPRRLHKTRSLLLALRVHHNRPCGEVVVPSFTFFFSHFGFSCHGLYYIRMIVVCKHITNFWRSGRDGWDLWRPP
jgi:hypothetical protein